MSQIRDFYADKTVFLTGVSGFLGKALLEKILRSCPNVGQVAVLIRPNKESNATERLTQILKDPLFAGLQKNNPQIFSKIKAIPGDLLKTRIVDDDDHLTELLENVHVVIHSAALVRFSEPLTQSIDANLRATYKLLEMAKSMEKLESFVHVSTAYSNCRFGESEERLYPMNIEARDFLRSDNRSAIEDVSPSEFGFPNVYTFTKFLTEQLVGEYESDLPLILVRPSIVTGAAYGPVPGWIDSFNGASGLLAALGSGFLTTLNVNLTLVADLIPVDFVANLIIAASMKASSDGLKIYNCTSSAENPVTWGVLVEVGTSCMEVRYAGNDLTFAPPKFTAKNNVHEVRLFLRHTIPSRIGDILLWLTSKKRGLVKIHQRILKLLAAIEFFFSNEWKFHNDHTRELFLSLSEHDREEFNFDVGSLNWRLYLRNYIAGICDFMLRAIPNVDEFHKLAKLRAITTHVTHAILLVGAVLLWRTFVH